jgi:hypothetical protein
MIIIINVFQHQLQLPLLLLIPSAPTVASSDIQSAYQQCGGIGWAGPTQCVSGYTCVKGNDYYYQCVPPPTAASSLAPNAVSQSPSTAPITNSPTAAISNCS